MAICHCDMTAPKHEKREQIIFTFLLSGKSVCGQEQRPDRCEDCSEMPNCVLDCFYDALSKEDSHSIGMAEQRIRDTIEELERRKKMIFNCGGYIRIDEAINLLKNGVQKK